MTRRTIQLTLDADRVDALYAAFVPIGKGTTKTECVETAIRDAVEHERRTMSRLIRAMYPEEAAEQ